MDERRLKIDEHAHEAGTTSTFLVAGDGGALAIVIDDESRPLPERALDAVMERYGAPFDASERVAAVGELELEDGARVRHVRHLARFDVIARDYLLYERPGRDPLCALATTVAGALDYVARASSQ
jgi:hypothetical protein